MGALCASIFSLSAPSAVFSETTQWFRSDGAGIAYEETSKAIAMRAEWALGITISEPAERGSGELLKGDRLEKKVLYERGRERRTVESYIDQSGFAHYSETVSDDGSRSTVRYDGQRRVVEEMNREKDGSGTLIKNAWFGNRLVTASAYALDAGNDSEPLWTDSYRYDRSGALLSVSRQPEGLAFSHDSHLGIPRYLEFRAADGSVFRVAYDEAGREAETTMLDPDGKKLSAEKVTYTKAEVAKKSESSRRRNPVSGEPEEVKYDERGREILLTRFDKDGKAVESIKSEWSGDRVAVQTRVRGDLIRRTEYAYDSRGNRILEKNYLNGRLERAVRKEGPMETEELYKNGALILRATYENGVLVREEREKRKIAGADQ